MGSHLPLTEGADEDVDFPALLKQDPAFSEEGLRHRDLGQQAEEHLICSLPAKLLAGE